jgi:low affinity Fe/Cu permease
MNTEEEIPRRHPLFERAANNVTRVTGSNGAFMIAVLIVLAWLITGPIFNYSDTWQLVINTGTTIVTFLMVFLIQKSQNKESLAIQLKLNELVAANRLASNRIVSIEDMTEEELRTLQKYYNRLAQLAMKEKHIRSSHSIEEAEELHQMKKNFRENKPA